MCNILILLMGTNTTNTHPIEWSEVTVDHYQTDQHLESLVLSALLDVGKCYFQWLMESLVLLSV